MGNLRKPCESAEIVQGRFQMVRGILKSPKAKPRVIPNLPGMISDQIVGGAAKNYLEKYSTRTKAFGSSQRCS